MKNTAIINPETDEQSLAASFQLSVKKRSDKLINYFLKKDSQSLAKWKQLILEKVGSLGKVLTDLIIK